MVSEFQGKDSDPVEIEQYTEVYLLKEIRMTLEKIYGEVRAISRIIVLAGIIAIIILMGIVAGNILAGILY